MFLIIVFGRIYYKEYQFKNNIQIGMMPKEVKNIYGKPDMVSGDDNVILYTYYYFLNKNVFYFSKKDSMLTVKWRENWYFMKGDEYKNN